VVSKIKLFGLGNALVDLEYVVSDEELNDLNIEKGLMTLIDEESNTVLANNGLKIHKQAGGGSAANTLFGFSQLGGSGYYSCKVANDLHGSIFIDDLDKEKIQNQYNGESAFEGVTGTCRVFVTPDGERTMQTFLGITQTYGVEQLDLDALITSEMIYVEGYLVASPTALEACRLAMKKAKENNIRVAFTLSDPSMPTYFKEAVDSLIDLGIDVLFGNEEEIKIVTGKTTLEDAYKSLKDKVELLVVTCGADGAKVFFKEESISVPGMKVNCIDTLGAGDLFAGAFLYGHLHGQSLKDSLELGVRCSGRLVETRGPRLTKEEILKLK
jgi:sugar/nucleoside kinase (ribokinase family)